MTINFSEFSLAQPLQQALADLEFTTPTEVQQRAIPSALAGKDLLVSSQTGSGKTFAFLLPTLNNLAEQMQNSTFVPFKERMRQMPAPSILVLCPTRELAQQVSKDAIKLVRHIKGIRVATVMGGMPFAKQIQELKGSQILVATPGRLLDLVNRRQLKLDQVQALIVDEADRMLDLGFAEDLEAISDLASNRQQTLMFSATFADRIIRLASKMTQDPERIAIETGHSTNTDVVQTLHWTDGFEHKKKLLSHWLADSTMDQVVVFASTQEDTDMLAEELAAAGHSVVALHGAMPQTVRNRRLRSIREGTAKILVATDVAARGLDVPTISHVINFGLPMKNEDYVHRIGRTGRAGRSGQAITMATHRERSKVRALEDYLDARLNVSEIEGLEPSPPPARTGRPSGKGERRSYGNGERRGGYGASKSRDGDRSRRYGEDRRAPSNQYSPARRVEGDSHFKRDDNRVNPRREYSNAVGQVAGEAVNRFSSAKPRFNDKPRFDDRTRSHSQVDGNRFSQRDHDERPRNFGSRSESTRSESSSRFGADRPARRFDDQRQSENRFARHDNTERRFSQGDQPRHERRYEGESRFNREERGFSGKRRTFKPKAY